MKKLRILIKTWLGMLFHVIIKRTIWERLTAIPKLFGYRIATVQVVAIDMEQQQLLVLETKVTQNGYTLPQGLCSGKFLPLVFIPKATTYADSRKDAAREFHEEAVEEKIDDDRFTYLTVYDESRFCQFRCHVYALKTTVGEFTIRKKTAAGKTTWISADEAPEKLANPKLTGLILSWLDGKHIPPDR